ncbi:MAG: hypothetical protein MMC33_008219 [Icmadophila ericetorum]|nr:hypothetical protein [Icmadophila ericetorum]
MPATNPTMDITQADYIIVGGGLTGCALASRLHQGNNALKILILEAGPDSTSNPDTTSFMGMFKLGSTLDWNFTSVPQPNTADRVYSPRAGKTLGGGSLLNYGGWCRGDPKDYDQWAKTVGDNRWSYPGLLPFFRKSESYFDQTADPKEHGFEGPMHVTSVSASDGQRKYPLREPIRTAWTELGIKHTTDSSGSTSGISEFLENWHNGKRQPANLAYSLEGITVLSDATIHRIVFSKGLLGYHYASAVLLTDGRTFEARKEIIICCGTMRTPQLLMLSGIGPEDVLSRFDIPVIHKAPEVGKNLWDHYAHYQNFKLREPEKGLALGSPLLTDPAYFKGMPVDWIVNEATPFHLLEAALKEDGIDRSLLERPCHTESLVLYSTLGAPHIPMNGTYVSTSVMLLNSTSRGSVSIASALPTDQPVIDPNHYATKADQVCLIHGTRRILQALLGTPEGQKYFDSEAPPPGFAKLGPNSSDAEIDARIRATGEAHYHTAGTAAMGKVVDTNLRVYGVRGLRVVDASVLPVAIGGHPQATLYALAEQAAEIILKGL